MRVNNTTHRRLNPFMNQVYFYQFVRCYLTAVLFGES